MDYSKLSDYEINKRVFMSITGAKPLGYPHNADGRSVGNESNGEYRWYDYCNNPADAWPIILKHRISIVFDSSDEGDEAAEWVTACVGNEEHFSGYHSCDKALRAAMIVFLMMQGSANVQDNSAR